MSKLKQTLCINMGQALRFKKWLRRFPFLLGRGQWKSSVECYIFGCATFFGEWTHWKMNVNSRVLHEIVDSIYLFPSECGWVWQYLRVRSCWSQWHNIRFNVPNPFSHSWAYLGICSYLKTNFVCKIYKEFCSYLHVSRIVVMPIINTQAGTHDQGINRCVTHTHTHTHK